jgi:hypothetical protein
MMNNLELCVNFGILHAEFWYCKSNNFLQEERWESGRLYVEVDPELEK